MKTTLYERSLGLNTVDDPVDVEYSKQGATALQVAVNITHRGNKGRLGRRSGQTLQQSGEFHSLFCDGGDCFVIQELAGSASLMRVNTDYSLTGVRSGLAMDSRTSFAQDGSDTYYTNGTNLGVITGGASNPWPTHDHAGSTTDRQFTSAPVGHHLAIAFTRMWIAENRADFVLHYSEPYAFGKFDRVRGKFHFHTAIRMVKPVAGGLFISDGESTWFYGGTLPREMVPVKVADYPALEWSAAIDLVEGAEIGLEPGRYALWASPEGLCAGGPTGLFINLTKERIIYPETVSKGATLLRGYNAIHCME